MHIFISGASGRNGLLTLQAALDNNHTVTALARTPANLPAHPNLTIVKGSPTSQSDVETALTTPHFPQAIITTLNPRRTSDNPFAPLSADSPLDLLESTTRILLAAVDAVMKRSTNKSSLKKPKLVLNSSFGVGESWKAMIWPMRLIFSHSTMKLTIADHNRMDALVRQSGLPFVLGRPARLVDGPSATVEGRQQVKALADDGAGCGWNPTISRASLGRWLVQAAETDEWDGKAPVLMQ